MTSFSVEVASICFGFVFASSLIVPSSGRVLRQIGEEESVILDDDSGLLHLVLGQRLTISHRGDQLPAALQPVQVLLGCGVLRVIGCSDTPMAAIIRNCGFVVTLKTNELTIAVPPGAPSSSHGLAPVKEQSDSGRWRVQEISALPLCPVAEFVNFEDLRLNSVRNGLRVDYRFQL